MFVCRETLYSFPRVPRGQTRLRHRRDCGPRYPVASFAPSWNSLRRHYAKMRAFREWTLGQCELPGRRLLAHRDRTPWVWEAPRVCAAESIRLRLPFDIARAGDRERHLSKERNVPRCVLLDLSPKCIAGQFNFQSRQFGGLRGWTRDHRCETAVILKNRAVIFGTNLFGRKTYKMHDPPEPIASARKLMTCRCCTHTRIDSAEY